MIKLQIMQYLPLSSSLSKKSLQKILQCEKCLVILDGLDEWNHPDVDCTKLPKDIPHRCEREKCVILTTTRPCKLSAVKLKSSQIDHKIELTELNIDSAWQLQLNAFKKIKPHLKDEELYSLTDRFNKEIMQYNLEDLESVPLLLMYLICLWCDDIPLGQSKCGLFTSIIELLLSRTMRKHPEMEQTSKLSQGDTPQCFSKQVQCKKNCTFLKNLGKLALRTLMSGEKEKTLVFDHSIAEKYLNPYDLKLSLLSGILSQNKQVSFSHKTVQEYFCALYISCQNESRVEKIVRQNCSSLQNILDMSTVFVFISGMNAKIISLISRALMPVVSADTITTTYRSMTEYDIKYVESMKDLQNMYISCVNENPENNDLCLQDVLIDEDCREKSYFTILKQLANYNKHNMESFSIVNAGVCSLRGIIDSCGLIAMFNIRKIYYWGECEEEEISLLLNRSVECVTVVSIDWQDDDLIENKVSSCSSELCKTFQGNSTLQAIYIDCFEMDHDVLGEFLNYITDRKSMTEIRLHELFCSTHRSSCPGFKLDFSQHSDLSLGLRDIPVLELKVDVAALVNFEVGRVPKRGSVTQYLPLLSEANKLRRFECSYLNSSDDITAMHETLPLLVQVKEVRLLNINLGEKDMSLSPKMVNIKDFLFYKVTMSAVSLFCVADLVEKLPQTVAIYIRDCNITPETEFEDVKKYIQKSESFDVKFDGFNQFNVYAFEFQTIKS